jgi:isopenicillin N synthase-like dioxygenase
VIKVAKRVEDLEQKPQKNKKPVAKKKEKAATIAWPSSTTEPAPEIKPKQREVPREVVRDLPSPEEKKTAEDQEYLEFQKYQENIRAAHRQSQSDLLAQTMSKQQKPDELAELRQQLHQFQAQ